MTGQRTGTRWGRAGTAMAVGFATLGGMGTAIYTSAFGLDASLIIQNGDMSFAISQMYAEDAGFGMAPVRQQNGTWRNVLRAGFAEATLNGLCLSKVESLPGVGNVTVKVVAGDGNPATRELSARNASFDITDLRAKGTGIVLGGTAQIGLATTDITTTPGQAPFDANPLGLVPSGNSPLTHFAAGGPYNNSQNGGLNNGQGWTGIDATVAKIDNLYGRIWSAQVSGDIILQNLSITVTPNGTQCAATPPADNTTFPN